jgi:hypothetical protein
MTNDQRTKTEYTVDECFEKLLCRINLFVIYSSFEVYSTRILAKITILKIIQDERN